MKLLYTAAAQRRPSPPGPYWRAVDSEDAAVGVPRPFERGCSVLKLATGTCVS